MSALVAPRFLPWLRTGLATQIAAPAVDGMAQADTVGFSIPVQLHAAGEADLITSVPSPEIRLYGPGDVVGISPSLVVRQDPEPGTLDAEDSFLALVEFSAPDLPWRYTPASAHADRLQPWIALVVVEDRAGVTLDPGGASRLPLLHVDDQSRELPDIMQCWAWAHVQADHALTGGVAKALDDAPEAFRSRLLSPRRLRKNRSWIACVVPTFAAGREAGGGTMMTGPGLTAWDHRSTAALSLPVYHSWRFKTGPGGDFELLVRRLQARRLPATVGRRTLDITHPGGGVTPTWRTAIKYEGALVSTDEGKWEWPEDEREAVKTALREVVNRVHVRRDVPPEYNALLDDPVVGAPAYAAAQAGQSLIPLGDRGPRWFGELNTEPQHRSVAGVAAEVIRRDQEALMAKAWEYAAGAREAGTLLSRARVAWEGARRLQPRVRALPNEVLVQLAAPAMARLRHASGRTITGGVNESALPAGLLSGAFRRLSHTIIARGTLRRRPVADALTREALLHSVKFVGGWADVHAPAGADVRGPGTAPSLPADAERLTRRGPLRRVSARQTPPAAGRVAASREYVLSTPWRPAVAAIPYSGDDSVAERLADDTRGAIDALGTIARMVHTRIGGLPVDRSQDVPDRMLVQPVFETAMYRRIVALSVEYLVPGLGEVPDNTLGVLEPNRRFIEAFLAGLNHEMGREFIWREYPAQLSDTWFQYFWEGGADASPDVVSIDLWKRDGGLGVNAPKGAPAASLVLLIKSAVLRRYPDIRVYAAEAMWQDGRRRERPDGVVEVPLFVARLAPDVAAYGFDLAPETARGSRTPGTRQDSRHPGYFFVLEQQPGAPRFGLDSKRPERQVPRSWSNLTWGHLVDLDDPLPPFIDLDAPRWLAAAGALPGNGPDDTDTDLWGESAAAMARITFQRPVRMLVHADSMLPETADGE